MVPLEDQASMWLSWTPYATEPTDKKGLTLLAAVIDPSSQRETELLVHTGGKKDRREPRGFPRNLELPCPTVRVNGKTTAPSHTPPKKGRTTEDSGPSRIKVWVTPPDKRSLACRDYG